MKDAQELLRIVGVDLMRQICAQFGGERIYIPSRVPDPERNDKIKTTFETELRRPGTTTMSSYGKAAEIYGITTRHAQRIIAE